MFSSQLSLGATQGQKPRQEEKQTILPVTVRCVEDAVKQRSADGELELFGTQPGLLLLVGMVEAPTQQPASLEFVMNDATGRLRVRHFATDGDSSLGACAQAGRYVTAVGHVRFSPEVHFTALSLRATQSPDEVSYHFIEAAHAALRLQRGEVPLPAAVPTTAAVTAVASPMKSASAAPMVPPAMSLPTTAVAAPAAALSSEQVLAYLRSVAEERPEGLDVAALCVHFVASPQAVVKEALERLVQAGEVFTTIDEEHYSAL